MKEIYCVNEIVDLFYDLLLLCFFFYVFEVCWCCGEEVFESVVGCIGEEGIVIVLLNIGCLVRSEMVVLDVVNVVYVE